MPEATPSYIGMKMVRVPYGPKTASGVGGDFGFVVPNGRYYVEISKPGFETLRSDPRSVESQVFGVGFPHFESRILSPTSTQVLEQPGEAARALAGQIAYRILKVQRRLIVRRSGKLQRCARCCRYRVGRRSFRDPRLGSLLCSMAIHAADPAFGRRRSASWGWFITS